MNAKKQTKPSPKNQLAFILFIVFVVLGVVVLLVSQYASKNIIHKADAAVDTHAASAASVMDDESGISTPTSALAYGVVGQKGGTTIEALEASGTNSDGRVVLRISVSNDNGLFGSADQAQNCYSYDFIKYTKLTEVRLDHCPNKPALKLPTPVVTPYNPKTAP